MAKKNEDTYSYKGWLNSDDFNKRVLAIMGYHIVGMFYFGLLYLAIMAVFGFFGLLYVLVTP